ncbi:hypothetical protein [Jeotgalibacillus terrae]|uniref:Uncharacterized protein n=1 Tax=Jeotgalibacillus terrae TaxID=587735 RepID=A0ABW5ZLW6_9BACL|nr:hypothetical protein [Jeotgalibacillus terrae]MBM7578132.1 membrane protein implicated in regulation of membrane protease activity [Jeotgalibacillus terrae]
MNDFVFILLAAAILSLQYFFSYQRTVYFGAIIPALFIAVLTWMYANAHIDSFLAYILIMAVVLLFLLEQWSRGRERLRGKRQHESDKMKTNGIN